MSDPVLLHLEPYQIPAMRASLDTALRNLAASLLELRLSGHVPEPWLGDDVSRHMMEDYNHRTMDSPTGPYAALLAYEAELTRMRDTLQLMEDHYRRTEGEVVELWGRT